MDNDQNGLQFKSNGQSKAVGIFMLVLGCIMGLSMVFAGINSISGSVGTGIFVIVFGLGFIGMGIWLGCTSLKKGSESEKRIQDVYKKYNIYALQQEIRYFTITFYVNPFDLGTVYFTERYIISTSEGVFPYGDIQSVSASKHTSRYGITDNYLNLTLQNGEIVTICQGRGKDPALKAQLVEFVNICVQKNRSIQADVKDLF